MLMIIFSVIMVTLILQASRKCAHGLMRKVGKWRKTIFLMQSKKKPKTTVWIFFTYVQKYRNVIDENFDSSPDNEPTFSESYCHEVPIVNMENIEEVLKEMKLHRVQKSR